MHIPKITEPKNNQQKLKTINFIAPWHDQEMYELLIHCIYSGFIWEQTAVHLLEYDYYIPRDQFDAFNLLHSIDTDINTGTRGAELLKK